MRRHSAMMAILSGRNAPAQDARSCAILELGHLGPGNSCARGISDAGHACGRFGGPLDHHACLWHDGERLGPGTPGGFKSEAFGMNDLNQVAGRSFDNPAGRTSGYAAYSCQYAAEWKQYAAYWKQYAA